MCVCVCVHSMLPLYRQIKNTALNLSYLKIWFIQLRNSLFNILSQTWKMFSTFYFSGECLYIFLSSIVPCTQILSAARSISFLHVLHSQIAWPEFALGAQEIIFRWCTWFLNGLVWHLVVNIFWYHVVRVQYILGSIKLSQNKH